ncbi:MAG TPA: zinc ribbon domain-containing protein [Candidatus Dormibacteraeota bacterium]|jgi:hypothetical protein|nr:zinc ribbon domain-containing protein [Candidatus Dormibacteraeota bacterium]
MATTVGRFCGRCGAPISPGVSFCGRCGTPIVAQAVAPAPVYAYAPAPPARYRATGQAKLAGPLIAGGLVLIVLVVAAGVGLFAIAQFAGGNRAPCTANCAPKIVTPLPEEASFRSSAFNFQVNYSSAWTVRDQNEAGITLGTKIGSVQILGSKGGTPQQALQATVAGLPSSKWQDVTRVSFLPGAHIGDQNGTGEVYSASIVNASQTATKVRFAVIAASRGGITVIVFAVNPADPKNSPNGMPEGQAFDYLCTEFVWG